ncbi:RER1 protein [Microthyrium microscopicum]|uniref:Protein RER1 n=1 Tax=Microthyrium microscopicum TaxID=703497 RepID=A0A6A6UK15_9PEZI|nr:RER1 protein [Microthyrium microscopicum]
MDAPEPEQTPFAAVSAQTTRLGQIYQTYLDKSVPHIPQRWIGTAVTFLLFIIRIVWVQGWYIVAYTLGIYLLNIFLAFITPKFDPSLEEDQDMEDGTKGGLPTKQDDEFRPFVRRLPEFKFWYSATKAITIALFCSFFSAFDLPVFWPVLVVYWCILFFLTMRRQIQHMVKYRYVPFTVGKTRYDGNGAQ